MPVSQVWPATSTRRSKRAARRPASRWAVASSRRRTGRSRSVPQRRRAFSPRDADQQGLLPAGGAGGRRAGSSCRWRRSRCDGARARRRRPRGRGLAGRGQARGQALLGVQGRGDSEQASNSPRRRGWAAGTRGRARPAAASRSRTRSSRTAAIATASSARRRSRARARSRPRPSRRTWRALAQAALVARDPGRMPGRSAAPDGPGSGGGRRQFLEQAVHGRGEPEQAQDVGKLVWRGARTRPAPPGAARHGPRGP